MAKRGRKKKNIILSLFIKAIIFFVLVILAVIYIVKIDGNFKNEINFALNRELSYKDKYIGDLDYSKYPFLLEDLKDKDIVIPESNSKNIVVGKNGFEYFIGETEKMILQGNRFIDAKWLNDAATMMYKLQEICDEQNKELYFMVIPLKDLLYPEYLPDGYYEKENDVDDIEILTEYINEKRGMKLLYPLEFMKKAKEFMRLYFSIDTHWNQAGGYIATEALYEMMGKIPKPISVCNFRKWPDSANGDYDYDLEYFGDGELLSMNLNGQAIANANFINTTSTAPDEREVTLVGDSFRYWILNVLEKDFKKANAIHSKAITYKSAKNILKRSDIIIVQVLSESYGELPYIAANIVNQLK